MALSKFNFNSFDVTTAASTGLGFNASANGFSTINPGAMTLIKTVTASNASGIEFVHGSSDVVLDSTYPVYLFKFINIHPVQIMLIYKYIFQQIVALGIVLQLKQLFLLHIMMKLVLLQHLIILQAQMQQIKLVVLIL